MPASASQRDGLDADVRDVAGAGDGGTTGSVADTVAFDSRRPVTRRPTVHV